MKLFINSQGCSCCCGSCCHRQWMDKVMVSPQFQLWFQFRNLCSLSLGPVICMRTHKGIEVLEGDGKSVGTLRLWKLVVGGDPNKVSFLKEKLEEVDDENRSITFRILDGELMEDYESFVCKLSVTPTTDGGSLVKWVLEFENKHEQSPSSTQLCRLGCVS